MIPYIKYIHVHGIIQSELQTSVRAPVDYKAIKEKDVGMDRWHDGGRIDRVVKGRMDGWWDKRKDGGMER